jgi:deoxyribonuclease-2
LRPLGATWAWPETDDHAKWGITQKNNRVCVGDINRMVAQENRGGGTVAFQDETLWHALSKTDLIVAPPGLTQAAARAAIKATHRSAERRSPKSAKSSATQPAVAKTNPPSSR